MLLFLALLHVAIVTSTIECYHLPTFLPTLPDAAANAAGLFALTLLAGTWGAADDDADDDLRVIVADDDVAGRDEIGDGREGADDLGDCRLGA